MSPTIGLLLHMFAVWYIPLMLGCGIGCLTGASFDAIFHIAIFWGGFGLLGISFDLLDDWISKDLTSFE